MIIEYHLHILLMLFTVTWKLQLYLSQSKNSRKLNFCTYLPRVRKAKHTIKVHLISSTCFELHSCLFSALHNSFIILCHIPGGTKITCFSNNCNFVYFQYKKIISERWRPSCRTHVQSLSSKFCITFTNISCGTVAISLRMETFRSSTVRGFRT